MTVSCSTTPVVPRMPIVATGVAIFMSPSWATLPATKAKVPSTSVNRALFDAPPASNEYSLSAIRVLATRLSAVPSGKPMPTEELAPVWTTSLL